MYECMVTVLLLTSTRLIFAEKSFLDFCQHASKKSVHPSRINLKLRKLVKDAIFQFQILWSLIGICFSNSYHFLSVNKYSMQFTPNKWILHWKKNRSVIILSNMKKNRQKWYMCKSGVGRETWYISIYKFENTKRDKAIVTRAICYSDFVSCDVENIHIYDFYTLAYWDNYLVSWQKTKNILCISSLVTA